MKQKDVKRRNDKLLKHGILDKRLLLLLLLSVWVRIDLRLASKLVFMSQSHVDMYSTQTAVLHQSLNI